MTKIEINGKAYILRFDMGVMEWMEEHFKDGLGGAVGAMSEGKTGEVCAIFAAMANAGADYYGQPMSCVADGILGKRSSVGTLKRMIKAIDGAVRDGMKATKEDNETTDEYLKEIEEQEKKA